MSSISLVNVTIDGVSYQANVEYTASEVGQAYQGYLQTFVDVFNMDASSATTDITQTTADEMSAAIQGLVSLAQEGKSVQVDPSLPDKTYYMTVEMGSNVDLLIQSLKAAGVADPASSITATEAQHWKSLAAASPVIANILQAAISVSGDGNRSLQSLVELIYVKTANEVLGDSLASLEDALKITKDSLDILAELQTLHNRITTNSKAPFSSKFDLHRAAVGSDPSLFRKQYPDAASAYFGIPIDPVLASGLGSTNGAGTAVPGPQFQAALTQLISLRSRLEKEITLLAPITDATSGTEGDTLLGKLKSVLDDLNTYFAVSGVPVTASTNTTAAFQAFKSWMLDNLDQHSNTNAGKAGLIQQNITFAITAGESLNDSQKEEVRRYLFVFEEYYKSASAILQALTQLITKMAQGISK
ncbi:hypothetical protein [Parachlamydia sp. AcF125]|uniref:hypothetical protein n=1 Tax=Parachlamydia sp. AcF125 TaxID=2795736 RepID=UPI001BC9F1F4|nr:hypothetical protein [Parachlamydia sp. AcF125]MBS4168092.1 hypothetical protein [Parachlamydia sp. AcF125]